MGFVQGGRLDVAGVADPAVSWTAAARLVDGDGAITAAIPEIVAGADFDAVAEAVDKGFGYALGAVFRERVREVAVLGEL